MTDKPLSSTMLGVFSALERAGRLSRVLDDIRDERARQHERWGQQDLPNFGPGPYLVGSEDAVRRVLELRFAKGEGSYADILLEEVAEAYEHRDLDHAREEGAAELRAELVQVGAVVVQWIEAIDRRAEG